MVSTDRQGARFFPGCNSLIQKTVYGDTVALVVFGYSDVHTVAAVRHLRKHWKKLYLEFGTRDFGIAPGVSTCGAKHIKVLRQLLAKTG